MCVVRRSVVSHLSQVCELPVWYDRSSPQVVDVDVVGGRGHGGLQVIVVAEGSSGHPDGKLHPAHPGALYGCGHKQQQQRLNKSFLLTFCFLAAFYSPLPSYLYIVELSVKEMEQNNDFPVIICGKKI